MLESKERTLFNLKKIKFSFLHFSQKSHLCTVGTVTTTTEDFCLGDEGGPLIENDGIVDRVVGIASWSPRCGSSWPSVFTRITIASVRGFIFNTTGLWIVRKILIEFWIGFLHFFFYFHWDSTNVQSVSLFVFDYTQRIFNSCNSQKNFFNTFKFSKCTKLLWIANHLSWIICSQTVLCKPQKFVLC